MSSIGSSSFVIKLEAKVGTDMVLLYENTIAGNDFTLNKKDTKLIYKEKSIEKHKYILFLNKDKINIDIKKVDLLNSVSGLDSVDIVVTVTVGDYVYVTDSVWKVKDKKNKTRYKAK